MTAPARPPRPTRLNVNTADPAELLRLPGVTEALARDIMAQRPLTKLKELLLIPGLEPEHYAQLEPYLTLAPRERPHRASGSARRSRRKAAAPVGPPPPPVAEPVVVTKAPPAPVWEEVPPAPEVIIVQPRSRTLTPTPARVPMVIAPPTAGRALFDSYAGPRIMFALFSVTLVLLAVGFSTGWINLGRPQIITVIAPTTTPDVLPTQVGLAVAATLTALPSPTALPATATPASTASPTPTFAATVNAPLANSGMANAGEQIFYETFIPAGYWDTGENSFSKITITEGGYLDILMKLPGSIAWAMNGFSGENFYYQGTVRVDACQLGDYDGLAFRFKDENNFFLFGLSCDGRYRLLERVEGEFHPLVDFTFTSAAIIGSNATNLLAVRADGAQLSLYVNDQFVSQVNVSTSYAGRFGVFAKSAQTANLLTEFDELSAWTLIR